MNIESLTSDAVKLLCQLIDIPRFSREETQAADMLEQVMSFEYGFDVNREGNNLWCVHPDYQPNRSTLLLNAHIDTVKPTAAWTRNPHEASIEDGIIYGLGSNDDGASLVSLIQVFRVLSQKTLSYNLILALSAEEEVSGKNGMEHLLTVMPKIDVALVGEPTGMHPAIAEKGLMVLDLTAHGKAGHAARNQTYGTLPPDCLLCSRSMAYHQKELKAQHITTYHTTSYIKCVPHLGSTHFEYIAINQVVASYDYLRPLAAIIEVRVSLNSF